MTTYLKLVSWTLKHRFITLGATILLFVASLLMSGLLSGEFVPKDDSDQTQMTLELSPDATLKDTTVIADMTAERIRHIDGVQSVFMSVGAAGGGADNHSTSENKATLNIVLASRGERPSKTQIEHAISDIVKDIPSARFTVGISAGGDTGYGFSLRSDNPKLLEETADKVMAEIRGLPNVSSVSSNKPLPKPELAVMADPMRMADKGVSTQSLADTLRIATQGDHEQALPKLNLDTRQIPIVVRLPDSVRADSVALSDLYVPSSTGDAVKIFEVADINFTTGEAQIRRLNRERSIKITVQSKQQLGEVVNAVKGLPSLTNLPDGVSVKDEGQADNMAELFTGFIIAMGVGVFCIFGVLVLLFHKVLQPLAILMALPLSVGGALIGLVLTGSGLSISSMIGFIMLMGIATKNSILLVDYAIIATQQGKSRPDAILDACRKRVRPIIMTTIAMGAGMLPLVFGWGGVDSTFRRPMAVAVLGGLITSTFLSLVVIPVVYTLMDDVGQWFKKTKRA